MGKRINEEKLLELYNALTDRNYPEGTPIKIITLDNVIFNEIKNDVAFIIDDRFIILTEHQSTLSPNFPLRMLCYLGKEYEKTSFSKDIFSTRLKKIPTPELMCFMRAWRMLRSNGSSNCLMHLKKNVIQYP